MFKLKLKEHFKDKILMATILSAALLVICHIGQYINSEHKVESLIRIIFFAIYIPMAIIIGREAWLPSIAALSVLILTKNKIYNYTSFVLMIICTYLNRKLKYILLSIYTIEFLVFSIKYDLTVMDFVIHFLSCIWIYFFVTLAIKTGISETQKKETKLVLTEKETYILKELKKGKRQKEIEGYAEGIISKVLSNCCIKNNCKDTIELRMRYEKENL